jgi:mono/diheme cytochrome c family protein
VTETRAEQEGDRRVAATVAAIVLLVLVVAAIVAAAAMAYRDDGKGDLLGMGKAPGAGAGGGHEGQAPPAPTNQGGNAAAGAQVFDENCSSCHGEDGRGGNGGPDLSGADNLQDVIAQVSNGGGGMPPFRGTLTDQQIRDVAAFVTKRVAK